MYHTQEMPCEKRLYFLLHSIVNFTRVYNIMRNQEFLF
jgi:hypothetical protein